MSQEKLGIWKKGKVLISATLISPPLPGSLLKRYKQIYLYVSLGRYIKFGGEYISLYLSKHTSLMYSYLESEVIDGNTKKDREYQKER